MRLKRWESPRRRGRNHKGSGGSARQRQIKKQHKLWAKRLKNNDSPNSNQGKDTVPSLLRSVPNQREAMVANEQSLELPGCM